MSHEENVIAPWYKQPWLWFILTPIMAAMVVGFMLLSVAIAQYRVDPPMDREVVRDGRGYVIDDAKFGNAAKLGLEGELRVDTLTGTAMLTLKGDVPEDLQLIELHAKVGANHQLDHVIKLQRLGDLNAFNGRFETKPRVRTEFILMPEARDWHLLAVAHPPFDDKTILFTSQVR